MKSQEKQEIGKEEILDAKIDQSTFQRICLVAERLDCSKSDVMRAGLESILQDADIAEKALLDALLSKKNQGVPTQNTNNKAAQ